MYLRLRCARKLGVRIVMERASRRGHLGDGRWRKGRLSIHLRRWRVGSQLGMRRVRRLSRGDICRLGFAVATADEDGDEGEQANDNQGAQHSNGNNSTFT